MQANKEKYFPNSEQFDYQKFPFYWIARVESLYTQEMEKTLKKVGMDASRWRVGLLLRRHTELTISEIANEALMKIPTITKIVQRMEKEGLVTVYKQKSDGRVRLVQLTAQGLSQVNMIVEATAPMFEDVFASFSTAEIETFLELSKRLFDNLEHSDD
ncbi:MarR family winged helix-turn-helix transcriptional regulator [uncultured Psychrobacter sp.]|uniref:MarR family winged helix-turn-helix transcriptional regulator n=1 Tax=uncultured Psychrobacter sp. TaxID=259303 RepID=UPI0034590570